MKVIDNIDHTKVQKTIEYAKLRKSRLIPNLVREIVFQGLLVTSLLIAAGEMGRIFVILMGIMLAGEIVISIFNQIEDFSTFSCESLEMYKRIYDILVEIRDCAMVPGLASFNSLQMPVWENEVEKMLVYYLTVKKDGKTKRLVFPPIQIEEKRSVEVTETKVELTMDKVTITIPYDMKIAEIGITQYP